MTDPNRSGGPLLDGGTATTHELDGQPVIELRHGNPIELVVAQATWPFATFAGWAGAVGGHRLVGVDLAR